MPPAGTCIVRGEQRYCLPSLLGVGTVGAGSTSLAGFARLSLPSLPVRFLSHALHAPQSI